MQARAWPPCVTYLLIAVQHHSPPSRSDTGEKASFSVTVSMQTQIARISLPPINLPSLQLQLPRTLFDSLWRICESLLASSLSLFDNSQISFCSPSIFHVAKTHEHSKAPGRGRWLFYRH